MRGPHVVVSIGASTNKRIAVVGGHLAPNDAAVRLAQCAAVLERRRNETIAVTIDLLNYEIAFQLPKWATVRRKYFADIAGCAGLLPPRPSGPGYGLQYRLVSLASTGTGSSRIRC